MKGMKIYGSFNADILSRSQYRLALKYSKYEYHGGGQAMLLNMIMGRGARHRLIAYIEHKSDLSRLQMKSRRKNTRQGYNRTPQIFLTVELQLSSMTLWPVTWVF